MRELTVAVRTPGVVVVVFDDPRPTRPLSWQEIEPWTKARAVTVADVRNTIGPAAVDLALSADLVYLRSGVTLNLASAAAAPGAGVMWALGRAGRPALARGLLRLEPLPAAEALAVGLVDGVLGPDDELPLPPAASVAALTAARDLMRSRATGAAGLGLELATFRLLFAAGIPEEGARAFLEKRRPKFPTAGD